MMTNSLNKFRLSRLKFPDVGTPIVRKSASKMFLIVYLYAVGIDRRVISELKTIGRHRVVRINQ